ncbi:MAG: transcriptional repressor [Alphaproteobacteria bacterium]|nr:MAG: transcriptional repressor [Alphaproteobacteria bacterium]
MPDPHAYCTDHRACVARGLAEIERLACRKGVRLTPVRRRVLEILLESHIALGAYDILARLSAEGMPAQPPVAYRALDFLIRHGLAHRIERLNAFVACAHPEAAHAPAFLICRKCRLVAEAVAGPSPLSREAAELGFRLETSVVEAEGLCPSCAGEG